MSVRWEDALWLDSEASRAWEEWREARRNFDIATLKHSKIEVTKSRVRADSLEERDRRVYQRLGAVLDELMAKEGAK